MNIFTPDAAKVVVFFNPDQKELVVQNNIQSNLNMVLTFDRDVYQKEVAGLPFKVSIPEGPDKFTCRTIPETDPGPFYQPMPEPAVAEPSVNSK